MRARVEVVFLGALSTPALGADLGGRVTVGGAAGFTHYQVEGEETDRFEPAGSPVVGVDLVAGFRATALTVGLESQPTFAFTFGGTGHLWSTPAAMLALGVETRPWHALSLGVDGSVGALAVTVGAHGRVHLAEGRAFDHELLVRIAHLPTSSGQVVVGYGARWGRGRSASSYDRSLRLSARAALEACEELLPGYPRSVDLTWHPEQGAWTASEGTGEFRACVASAPPPTAGDAAAGVPVRAWKRRP